MEKEKCPPSPSKDSTTTSTIQRGHLKIFMGYAAGVGKTFTMLNEGNRRLKRGEDIVIGFLESHGREETSLQVENLEVLPRKKVLFGKDTAEEMDTDLIISRKPSTVLIDELAHTNVPGSKNKKRYLDVEEILSNGINVITTLNIQHLESLNDLIKQITGTKVKDTIPNCIVERADEVVVVDLTPDALINRLNRGNIYNLNIIPQDLRDFFRKGTLNALRELVLREAAEEVEDDLTECIKSEDIKDNWKTVEHVMVCISAGNSAKKLIRCGARIANRYKCEWIVVNVNCTNTFAKKVSLKSRQRLYTHFQLAKQLGAEVVTLTGKSVSEELSRYAHEKLITQIVIGHANRSAVEVLLRGSTVEKLLQLAKNVEIHVIPNDDSSD